MSVLKRLSILLLPLFVIISGCSNLSQKIKNPCEIEIVSDENDLIEDNQSLKGIRSHTRRKVVLMPVTNANSSNLAYVPQINDLTGFATEIMNQSFRNEGIKTVAWFKVSKKLKEVIGSTGTSAYGPLVSSNSLVNDENINELITTAKELGACYIVRPVILKSTSNVKASTQANPLGVMFFGGLAVKQKIESNAEVDLKIDIINTNEEDIIASKTFSGRSVLVGKERANVLDGITGSQIFSSGTDSDQTRIAFYDTIDKIVDFFSDKME